MIRRRSRNNALPPLLASYQAGDPPPADRGPDEDEIELLRELRFFGNYHVNPRNWITLVPLDVHPHGDAWLAFSAAGRDSK